MKSWSRIPKSKKSTPITSVFWGTANAGSVYRLRFYEMKSTLAQSLILLINAAICLESLEHLAHVYSKKEVRKSFEKPTDTQVFGYTIEEKRRLDRFIDANNNVKIWAPLIDFGLTKAECLEILERAEIALPAMYKLGYQNNNCIGCVKGGVGYWNKIRVDFPDVFQKRAEQSRRLGARLCNYQGKRMYLDELPPDAGNYPTEIMPECGIACEYVLDITK